jgi:hypothetical protein
MTEDFLHFVWRTRNFHQKDLRTTTGQRIEILDFGQYNSHAGPDFLCARLTLDGVLWAGNVEMHLLSSDWIRHRHVEDPLYSNVILHVVLEEDVPVEIEGRRLECLELKEAIDRSLIGRYQRLLATMSWVPCGASLPSVDFLVKEQWLDRMMTERMETKIENLTPLLELTHDNWDEVLYRLLARAFGFHLNSEPFQRVARLLPLRYLYKHADSPEDIAALLFGTAGLLNRIFLDTYPAALQKNFFHLSYKYGIESIDARAWNKGRTRPSNLPTIRIAQFAALMCDFQSLFSAIMDCPNLNTLQALFMKETHPYWQTHSDFDLPVRKMSCRLGVQAASGIVLNTLVPFLMAYGKRRQEQQYVDFAFDLLQALPAEENSVTRKWTERGMLNGHAGHSQALLHLKKHYCDSRACLSCAIGAHILSPRNL